jgi:hypothetical protein
MHPAVLLAHGLGLISLAADRPIPEPIRCCRCGTAGPNVVDRHDGVRWRTYRVSCCADLGGATVEEMK